MIAFDEVVGRWPSPKIRTAAIGRIEGWLSEPAAELSTWLVHLQRCWPSASGVLELGVHHGRYLALLAAAHTGDIPLVGVDALLAGDGSQLLSADREVAKARIRTNVRSAAGDQADPHLIGAFTRDLDLDAVRSLCPGGFSFISVDGGHTASDVEVDLRIAQSLASPDAVVAIDDAFNPRTPGVPEAVARYLYSKPIGALRPFATAGNKLFAAGSEAGRERYLAYCHWLIDTRQEHAFVTASAAQRDTNRANRFVPEYFGYELATFLYADE